MKPGVFEYVKADSVESVLAALQQYGGDARILAGGQSLMPLMNMRMLRPAALIDVNAVPGLDTIRLEHGFVHVGALVRYHMIEKSEVIRDHLPLVSHAIRRVADRQVRNRGTLGGSLCHSDPAAQMPLCAQTLCAKMVIAGPDGRRTIPALEFFQGAYTTAVDPLEMLVEIIYPASTGATVTLQQQTRRHGDFPAISIAVSVQRQVDGRWTDWRIGMGGLNDHPLPAGNIATFLEGKALTEAVIAEAAAMLPENIDPSDDIRATAEYRLSLAPIYITRALTALLHGDGR